MATVLSVEAIAYGGQLYIPFDTNSLPGPFSIYIETSAISSLSGLSAKASVTATSGLFPYDDSAAADLQAGLVIPDGVGGTRTLTADDGLYVWTPTTSGSYYVAVVHAGDLTLTSGVNSTSSSTAITAVANRDLGGLVVDSLTPVAGYTTYRLLFWDDSRIHQAAWGYPGRRVNLSIANAASEPCHVRLYLHSAPGNGYAEPFETVESLTGMDIYPRDLDWSSGADPYTGAMRSKTCWYGNAPMAGNLVPNMEQFLLRVTQFALDHGETITGKTPDPNRVYLIGGSMGGMAHGLLFRNPDVFAAGLQTVPGLDTEALEYGGVLTDGQGATVTVNGSGTVNAHFNADLLAASSALLPTYIHGFDSDDGTWGASRVEGWTESFLAAMRANKRALISLWHAANTHMPPTMPSSGSYFYETFTKNEARVIFSDVDDDDDFADDPGQRGSHCAYGRTLATLSGEAISDTVNLFTAPIKATNGSDRTSGILLENFQNFPHTAGLTIAWAIRAGLDGGGGVLASGTAQMDSLGRLDLGADLDVPSAGAQIRLTDVTPRIPWLRVA